MRGFQMASLTLGSAFLFIITAPAGADVDPHGGMLRYPDVSESHIAFVYANDIWVVPRDGGSATPVASPAGPELFPRFSPDGQRIGFVGNYDGGTDIYTIGVLGGVPQRLTHHPDGEILSDWTADDRLIFSMSGLAGLGRQAQLFTVGPDGGMPEKLPVPYGARGAISEDGAWLAYTPFNRDTRTWKRYRGGLASDIWLFNLQNNSSKQITDWEGTDTIPMWHGDKLYYLSDEGEQHRLNIWVYDTASGERRQITTFSDHDIKWPSIGPGAAGEGEIVFQYGAELRLLNLQSESMSTVEVTIPGDRPTIRPRTVDFSEMIQDANISSTGKRALMQARGDIWSLPAETGVPRNLTSTSGFFERDPAWSPDGQWVAWFSDADGEYELYATQSDGRGETRQLTDGSTTFYMNPTWSPDSKKIAYNDKAGNIWVYSFDDEAAEIIATDPFAFDFSSSAVNWSHDSRWLGFALSSDERVTTVHLYDLENGSVHEVTAGQFYDSPPVFDRKGDWLYFSSTRSFAPSYSDFDTTWIYDDSQVLVAVPLREDVEYPWTPESDEEEFKTEEEEEAEDEGADDGEDADEPQDAEEDDAADEDPAEEEEADDQEGEGDDDDDPVADDGVSGTYECTLTGDQLPPDGVSVTITLSIAEDGTASGSVTAPTGSGSFSGTLDKASGALTGTITLEDGTVVTVNGTIKDGELNAAVSADEFSGNLTGRRTAPAAGEAADEDEADDKPREVVEIDLDGFEQRAIELPVPAGSFGALAVNDRNQLIYVRRSQRGGSPGAAIKLFDISSDEKTEQNVAAGATSFEISGDGKKILVQRGRSASIQNAAAGATAKDVPTEGMSGTIDPREEWRQILNDAWRLQRIYFYDPNMHGVDWQAVHDHYAPMIDDAVDRDDVGYIVSEMISELNVGHAYYGGGDIENPPDRSVGMLGVDFELDDENDAYRIARIISGAPWDVDARNPLAHADVKEGDYILAVNGNPVSTAQDPWAPFVGLAGRVTELTVSESPTIDDSARRILVEPIRNESNLRYRAWIEQNRKHVEEQSGGKVGYIYVPDTGVNGQTNLVRQFIGAQGKPALIIDERWNGGGQIPTRFIEMLNRPVTNYWARRDQNDWMWPPDSHQGPKCMLINGPSGSGGDAFPYYFKQAGLGKLIGRRTWGGLVGISGTPGLIDNARVTVPTFAFYENDGTWGIEGYGVDPDLEVIDDPAKMVDGGDPQLDAAIELMLEELKTNPYVAPKRPPYPDRSGFGITDEDR